jgi:nanoRNase/pAp phosphatase (c-di-AMP/oligoRNAs hydrolase)
MILPPHQITELRDALEAAKRPLFFYDDDPDGLSSFLLLYRHGSEGRGVLVKTTSTLTKSWVYKITEYGPDTVFVLDVPAIDQDFLDEAQVPVYWVDHHTVLDRTKVHYYNPHLVKKDVYIPTTRMAYEIVKDSVHAKRDLWIAAVGCVGDWYLPDFREELDSAYPGLLPARVKGPEDALFDSPAGQLARIFSFLLKGKTSDVFRCVKVLTRIMHPDEILKQTTAQGKFIFDRFTDVNEKYQKLLASALKSKNKGAFFIFKYEEDQWSFTSELSNELAHYHPKKVILVCRERDGTYKCSFRTRDKPILPALQKALEGIEGKGGGHDYACGAVIKSEDFERFVEKLKKEF